eukprot:scaffold78_cov265-Pinguiococcus_pyrenoidosus.AAC.4
MHGIVSRMRLVRSAWWSNVPLFATWIAELEHFPGACHLSGSHLVWHAPVAGLEGGLLLVTALVVVVPHGDAARGAEQGHAKEDERVESIHLAKHVFIADVDVQLRVVVDRGATQTWGRGGAEARGHSIAQTLLGKLSRLPQPRSNHPKPVHTASWEP